MRKPQHRTEREKRLLVQSEEEPCFSDQRVRSLRPAQDGKTQCSTSHGSIAELCGTELIDSRVSLARPRSQCAKSGRLQVLPAAEYTSLQRFKTSILQSGITPLPACGRLPTQSNCFSSLPPQWIAPTQNRLPSLQSRRRRRASVEYRPLSVVLLDTLSLTSSLSLRR